MNPCELIFGLFCLLAGLHALDKINKNTKK